MAKKFSFNSTSMGGKSFHCLYCQWYSYTTLSASQNLIALLGCSRDCRTSTEHAAEEVGVGRQHAEARELKLQPDTCATQIWHVQNHEKKLLETDVSYGTFTATSPSLTRNSAGTFLGLFLLFLWPRREARTAKVF